MQTSAAVATQPLLLLSLLLSAVCAGSAAQSFCDAQPGWRIDWQDEFDGESLNASSWSALDLDSYDIGSCRDAACLPENVQVSGGALHLRSERRQIKGYNFTTAAVRTKGKRSWAASPASWFRVCVSAILPGEGHGSGGAAQGIWPAHWMMPDTAGCWPDLGEMDILEMINGDGRAHATYHWESNYPAKNCSQVTSCPSADFALLCICSRPPSPTATNCMAATSTCRPGTRASTSAAGAGCPARSRPHALHQVRARARSRARCFRVRRADDLKCVTGRVSGREVLGGERRVAVIAQAHQRDKKHLNCDYCPSGALVHHSQHCSAPTTPRPVVASLLHSQNAWHSPTQLPTPPRLTAAQVGGDWAGPVGPNTRFPTSHAVEYVRVAVSL